MEKSVWLVQDTVLSDCVMTNGTASCYVNNGTTMQQCLPGDAETALATLGEVTYILIHGGSRVLPDSTVASMRLMHPSSRPT